ncbi:MAG: M15 family metallopeptidase [Oscillospiraceae bacterium]|nr:M15 family metallopeptidase [Oscillospiraceae bacterium]
MHRRKRKKLLPRILVLATLAIGIYAFAVLAIGDGIHTLVGATTPSVNGSSRASAGTSANTSSADNTAPAGLPPFTGQMRTTDLTDTRYLKLVNRELPVRSPVDSSHLVPVWPDIAARTTYVTVHERIIEALRALFVAARNADFRSLFIASGYRSREEQAELYANAANRDYVMPPGHSEHQLGLAVDILSGDGSNNMRGSAEAQWLAENAAQFGFILRYPYGRQDITGAPYEPWHFRYVGRVHAWYMGQRDFVLEEYIAYLQTEGGFRTQFSGRTYYVLYQRPENGMILVPEDLDFWVSSANTGGYVVTAWR